MKKRRCKNVPSSKVGRRHPLDFVAAELGVDRQTLLRRCQDAGLSCNGSGLKFSEAYDALSLKSVSEAARRRKTLAEAESSEIDTLQKKGLLMYRNDHAMTVKDIAVQTRVTVERADYVPKDSRKRLLKELAEIKPSARP
jgi:hypothetical protein